MPSARTGYASRRAAAYAAVTPLLEVPSGILADRWSRRGVLGVSALALAACATVGGLSRGVGMYMVSAMVLGVYFAMYSGTMESVDSSTRSIASRKAARATSPPIT